MPDAELLYMLSLVVSGLGNLTIIVCATLAYVRRPRLGLIVLGGAGAVGLLLSLAYGICGAMSIFMSGHPAIYGSLFLMDITDSILYAVGVVALLRELNAMAPTADTPGNGA